jgi:hypothetical protein
MNNLLISKELQELLDKSKNCIEAGNPEGANGYLTHIKNNFPCVILNMAFTLEQSKFHLYHNRDFTFFTCNCTRETFGKLGSN